MLWATDFFPLWKKVSGVQILLARRLLRGNTCMGPSNFSLSSLQLWRKKTSMVYSWGGTHANQSVNERWWPLLTPRRLSLRLMGWHVEQSIWRHPCWRIRIANTRKSKHFPVKNISQLWDHAWAPHCHMTTCVIHAFFHLQSVTINQDTNEPQPRKSPCNTPVSCFINLQPSFCVVANARGANKIERIQEVACRKEFISYHPFQCELCPSNRGPASAAEQRRCRANAAVSPERDGSQQLAQGCGYQWSIKVTTHALFLILFVAAADEKTWAGAEHREHKELRLIFRGGQPAPALVSSRIMTLRKQVGRTDSGAERKF